MIERVILWKNGIVMVFDEKGEQMVDYQGPKHECRERILKDAPDTAKFMEGEWSSGKLRIIERCAF